MPIKPDTELWRFIDNTQDKYMVSNMGRILSLKKVNGIYLTISLDKNKTPVVRFYDHETHKKFLISVDKCVAHYFVPNPDRFKHIRHKDGNPFNNKYDNLEWCDDVHQTSNGLPIPLIVFDRNFTSIQTFNSCKEAAENIGCSTSTVTKYIDKSTPYRTEDGTELFIVKQETYKTWNRTSTME